MTETLYEIETWRGGWFYRVGSRYTGPFALRRDAVDAAETELMPYCARTGKTMRRSLAPEPSAKQHGKTASVL